VGDVKSNAVELTPVAIKEAEIVAKGIFKGEWSQINYSLIPTTVFTPLEYSKCGLSEEDAVTKYGKDHVEVFH
jgi:thioredoxin reductase (NADPH)